MAGSFPSSIPFYGAPRFPLYVPHTPHLRGRFYMPPLGMVAALFPCFFFTHIGLPIRVILLVFGILVCYVILVAPANNRLIHRSGNRGFRIFTSLFSLGIQHHRKLPYHHRRPRLPPHLPLKLNPSKLASSKSLTPKTLVQEDKMPAASVSSLSLAWSHRVSMLPQRRVTQHTTPRSQNRGPVRTLHRSSITHCKCGLLVGVVG